MKMKHLRKRIIEHFKNSLNSLNNQQAFSLTEILIALTIVGLTSTFVVGKLFEKLQEGKIQSTQIQMNNLAGLLKEYRRQCGQYPTSEQGLEALAEKPGSAPECKRYPPGGFIDDGQGVPVDPWGNAFVYTSDGKTFNIKSYGNDGVEGGEGNDADIYLYDPKGTGAATAKDSSKEPQ